MPTILFNKPFGVLSQFTPEGNHRALDEFHFPKGVYAAGRLDHDSEGALLLTDDGKLIHKLLDPKNGHPRTYLVQVEGQISEAAIQKLENGVLIKGYRTQKCRAEIVPETRRSLATPSAGSFSGKHSHILDKNHPDRGQKPPGSAHDRRGRLSNTAPYPHSNWKALPFWIKTRRMETRPIFIPRPSLVVVRDKRLVGSWELELKTDN